MEGLDNIRAAGPVLVWANWYRFRAGEHIRHSHVHSVAFIWAVRGSGVIWSCGESFDLTTDVILRLPWSHDVSYLPDELSPFHLGTIHLVPTHDFDKPVEARVAFQDEDTLLSANWRRGPAERERPMAVASHSATGRNVISLGSYGVERFLSGRTDEQTLRSLGNLLMDESSTWAGTQPEEHGNTPIFDLMTNYILANIDRLLPVAEIARAGGCSVTTAERIFARYTGTSVVAWSRRRRIQDAARLLRTSSLRINEVARLVGYSDALYFSRVFSSVYGVAPSRYALGQLRP